MSSGRSPPCSAASSWSGSISATAARPRTGSPAPQRGVARICRAAQTPFPMSVASGALHCGSGCTLGDICADWLVFLAPTVAVWFGWHSLFADKIFATWIVDFLIAFGFGVVLPAAHHRRDPLAPRQRRQMAGAASRAWSLGGPDLHSLGPSGRWERLLALVQERGLRLGMTFLDGTNIRAQHKAVGAAKIRMLRHNETIVRRMAALVAAMAPRPACWPTASAAP